MYGNYMGYGQQMGAMQPTWPMYGQQYYPMGAQLNRDVHVQFINSYDEVQNSVLSYGTARMFIDVNAGKLYIKAVDEAGKVEVESYNISKVEPEAPVTADYVTREDFEQLKAQLTELRSGLNHEPAKQPQQNAAIPAVTNAAPAAVPAANVGNAAPAAVPAANAPAYPTNNGWPAGA